MSNTLCIRIEADEFETKVFNPEQIEEEIVRKCSNAFCNDKKTVRKVIAVEDKCYETEENRSCKHCCEIDVPTKSEFDNARCVVEANSKTGFKTILKKSECEDVDYQKDFKEQCSVCEEGFSGPNCNTVVCTGRCLGKSCRIINNYAYCYTDIPTQNSEDKIQARLIQSNAKAPGLFIFYPAIFFVLK